MDGVYRTLSRENVVMPNAPSVRGWPRALGLH
jgi:hypothetical protein